MAGTSQQLIDPTQTQEDSPVWHQTTRHVVGVFLVIAGILVIVLMGAIFQTLVWAFLFAFAAFGLSEALARHKPISYRAGP